MIIQKKKIRNTEKYLSLFSANENFYVTVPVSEDIKEKILKYGLSFDGTPKIPIPIGKATEENANGIWKVRKDLPKENRSIERSYHIVDWHGNDHYGISFYDKLCYKKVFIPPTEISFQIENRVIYSQLLCNTPEEMRKIKVAINVLLEIFGFCELRKSDKNLLKPTIPVIAVPWEILRAGTKEKNAWDNYLDKTLQNKSKSQKVVIKHRHEYLWKQNPDFCALGKQNFWGYIVYAFTDSKIYIFESDQPDNATYIFYGDWKAASKLTKTEILAGHLHKARIFHNKNWYNNVKKYTKE